MNNNPTKYLSRKYGSWVCSFCGAPNANVLTSHRGRPLEEQKADFDIGYVCHNCDQTNYLEDLEPETYS